MGKPTARMLTSEESAEILAKKGTSKFVEFNDPTIENGKEVLKADILALSKIDPVSAIRAGAVALIEAAFTMGMPGQQFTKVYIGVLRDLMLSHVEELQPRVDDLQGVVGPKAPKENNGEDI